MWLKIAGAVIVILAGGALGFYYSGLEAFRVQDLGEFKKALLILKSEIEYLRTPLAEACLNIAKRTEKPANGFLESFADGLSKDGGAAYPVWARTVDAWKKKAFLSNEDWDVLDGFGKTLGYLDTQMQLNAINFVTDYIDAKTATLQENGEKTKRMYRSLGWIGGAIVAVVLM